MNNIKNLKALETMLKTELEVEIGETFMSIQCSNRCRLISHLFHRAGLDVHCNNEGLFRIPYETYSIGEVISAMGDIVDNPVWIVEFVEKYLNNEFMMSTTFGTPEVEA